MHLNPLALLLPLACLAAPVRAQTPAAPLDPSTVPVRGARAEAFVPLGWKIAAQVAGDLNGDGRADRVLHLVPCDADSRSAYDILDPGPYTQGLVILLAESGGGWRRAGVAPQLLYPDMPQWSLQLAIRRGVLIVNQYYGLATRWDITHRFRLDAPGRRFVLIGRDRRAYDHAPELYTLHGRSDNYLTGVRLVTVGHSKSGGPYRTTVERRSIPRRRVAFEDVR